MRCEAVKQRQFARQAVSDLPGERIHEDADAAADDGVLHLFWRPGKSKTRLEGNGREAGNACLAQSGSAGCKAHVPVGSATLANGPLNSQSSSSRTSGWSCDPCARQSKLQIALRFPVVLHIPAELVQLDGLHQSVGKVLQAARRYRRHCREVRPLTAVVKIIQGKRNQGRW